MSGFTIRRAVTSNAKPLIGLHAESGGGKTHSALLLACGFVGGDMAQVCMVETESGRGEAWADDPVIGGYSVLSLRQDFSPRTYGAAIAEAEKQNVQALIVDSGSHEWSGVGGVLSMAAANQEAGKKGPIVWQKPKMDHQREFMLRLTQSPIPLIILCLRSKYPMYEVTQKHVEKWIEAGRPGKQPKVGEWARSWELEPIQAEDVLFEMFVHGWLDKDKHHFHGTKYTINALRDVIKSGEAITVETGKRLAEWSKRRAAAPKAGTGDAPAQPEAGSTPAVATSGANAPPTVEFISTDAVIDLRDKMKEARIEEKTFTDFAGIASLSLLPRRNSKGGDNYANALKWIERETEKK